MTPHKFIPNTLGLSKQVLLELITNLVAWSPQQFGGSGWIPFYCLQEPGVQILKPPFQQKRRISQHTRPTDTVSTMKISTRKWVGNPQGTMQYDCDSPMQGYLFILFGGPSFYKTSGNAGKTAGS